MIFGHQTDDANQGTPSMNSSGSAGGDEPMVNPLAVDPETGVGLPAVPEELIHEPEQADEPAPQEPASEEPSPQPEPAAPAEPPLPASPADDDDSAPTLPPASASDDTPADDLLSLKQQALQQLSPLVDHLDQTPEEKFRTTMMMIQGTDNQTLIKEAYAAAQAIPDDKVRAQALLDIVNEINYFTHRNDQ